MSQNWVNSKFPAHTCPLMSVWVNSPIFLFRKSSADLFFSFVFCRRKRLTSSTVDGWQICREGTYMDTRWLLNPPWGRWSEAFQLYCSPPPVLVLCHASSFLATIGQKSGPTFTAEAAVTGWWCRTEVKRNRSRWNICIGHSWRAWKYFWLF